jgi:hypothetical protein
VIHYHGGPIAPETCAWRVWHARHAFISFAAPRQIKLAAGICQSFALDNGAFSLWRAGAEVDWPAYYDWCGQWLPHPACDWAVIPDVIGGTEEENDALTAEWPFGHRGVPVWHLNESGERLVRLAATWPRVALGSAAEWDVSVPSKCLERLREILPVICRDGQPTVKLHGLRMLSYRIVTSVPLASADSTNVGRNIGIDSSWSGGDYMPANKETRALVLTERIEAWQSPPRIAGGQGVLWEPPAKPRRVRPAAPPDEDSLWWTTVRPGQGRTASGSA